MKVSARMQIRSLSYKPGGPRILIRDTTENVMSQYVYEFIHVYKYSYIKIFLSGAYNFIFIRSPFILY